MSGATHPNGGPVPPAFGGMVGLTEEHVALHASARRWVENHIDPKETKAGLDAGVESRPSFWDDVRGLGWLGLHLSADHGGEGYGLTELAVVLEELGRAAAPGPFLSTVLTSAVIDRTGTVAQRAAWLPGLADGSRLGAVAIPARGGREDGRGAPAGNDPAPAIGRRGPHGSIVVDGVVRPVLGAGLADLLVLPVAVATHTISASFAAGVAMGARLDTAAATLATGGVAEAAELAAAPHPGPWATCWCVIDPTDPGVEVRPLASADGTRRVAEVRLNGVTVLADEQLGAGAAVGVDGGGTVTAQIAELAAALSAAEAVGGLAWCVETAAAHAAARVQFGRPIGQFQAVKHRVAGMLLGLELTRAATWDAARALDDASDDIADRDTGGDPAAEASLAAAVAGAIAPAAYLDGAKDAVSVLGGICYTWEHDAHLHLKRASAMHHLLGGPHPWRARVAALALAGVRRTLSVALPPSAEPVRDEVRAFIASTKAGPKDTWTRAIADAGYQVPYWPPPWGRGAGPLEQLVIDEELDRARLRRPHLQVGGWVLPTLIAHGTREQQERWIRPTLHGEILWCQLFSEPEAGSDLASLTTRARRDDGRAGWVITGQKVWTTMAHVANWGILLARTDPDAPKHEGITCFILDMSSPGIDIRPLRELTGAELFNEVFLTDAFVPDDCVVGAVNAGWEAARTTLANERVSMGSGSSFGPGLEAVLALVASDAGEVVHDEIGALVATGEAIAVLGLRMTLKALGGARPGAEASVRKLLATEHEQHVQEVGLGLLGSEGATTDGAAAVWVNGFLGNRALSIAGGTSDIQRSVVAERLLGLPKDAD